MEAVYDEDKGIWNVRVAHADGSEKWDTCHVFINAAGVLNNYKCKQSSDEGIVAWADKISTGPDIPNRESFQGNVVHTAAWDENVDWNGKKVAVIGTGSSAIQVTPKVQEGKTSQCRYLSLRY